MKVAALLLALVFAYGCHDAREPETLEVHLRCPASPPAGALTLNGQTFDIPTACGQRNLRFDTHPAGESLTLRLRLANGGPEGEAKAVYGEELQRDRTGFHAIFEILSAPPYVRAVRL